MPTRARVSRLLMVAAVLAGAAGCSSILGEGREERTALLVTDPRLTVDGKGALVLDADSVNTNAPLTVRIRTAGGGCIRRAFVDIKALPDGVELRPYNSYRTSGSCTDDFRVIEHVVARSFLTPGIKRVRAVGVSGSGAVVSVEDSVVVR